jgi:AAA family ATP:ADP antiporter
VNGAATEALAAERRVTAWAAAYHFLLLSSYYVVRPLRDAMGLKGDVKKLPWLMLATLVAMALTTPLFAALVDRLPRRRFVPLVYHLLALQLGGFAIALAGTPSVVVARAFFIWASVFNLFAVSVFWGFMADRFAPAAAARRYGVIAFGGTLGAMAGAAIATLLASRIDPARLPWIAALLLEAAVFCFFRVSNGATLRPRSTVADATVVVTGVADADKAPAQGTWHFVRTLAHSPYLGAIAGYMLLYTITSTFAYLEQARLVQAAVHGDAARTALFARMDLWVNLASLVLQALCTRWLLDKGGVTVTLSILPALTLAGFAALAIHPSLGLIIAFQIARRTTDYFAARPARELCYVVVDRESKYAAKSFIDTFVYRGGDALGAAAFGLVGVVAPVVALPVCAVWLVLTLVLGRLRTRLARP